MEQEFKTVSVMIDLYCRGHHGSRDHHCVDCEALLTYVGQRLEKCPLKTNKPKCSKCTVHCYKPDMREKIKAVMRYSGPRMIYRHLILAGKHFLNKN